MPTNIDLSRSNRKPWPNVKRKPEEVSSSVLGTQGGSLGNALEQSAFGYSYENTFGIMPDLLTSPPPITGQKQLPEGMNAVKPTPIVQPAPAPSVSDASVQDIVKKIGNIGSGFTKIKLADGTEIGGIAAQPTLPGEGLSTREGTDINVDRPGALPVAEEEQGFFGKVNDFVSSPTFSALLAQAASAIGQGSPGIQQAAGFAMQLAQSDASKEYKQALEEGRNPDEGKDAAILTPEMKQQIHTSFDEKRSAKVKEDYTRALTTQAEAVAEGTLTADDKKKQAMLELAVSQEQGYMRNSMMNLGQGHILDVTSGNIIQAYNYQTGSAGDSILGNLNSAAFKTFNDYNNATFAKLAKDNMRQHIIKTKGQAVADLKDFTTIFQNADKTYNTSAILENLTPEQSQQYSEELVKYTMDHVSGRPAPMRFHQQQVEGVGALRNETRANEKTTPEGYVVRYDPKKNKWIRIR